MRKAFFDQVLNVRLVGEFANPEAERQNKEVARSELPVGLGALDWVAGGLRRNNPQTTVKWLSLLLGPVLSRFYLIQHSFSWPGNQLCLLNLLALCSTQVAALTCFYQKRGRFWPRPTLS